MSSPDIQGAVVPSITVRAEQDGKEAWDVFYNEGLHYRLTFQKFTKTLCKSVKAPDMGNGVYVIERDVANSYLQYESPGCHLVTVDIEEGAICNVLKYIGPIWILSGKNIYVETGGFIGQPFDVRIDLRDHVGRQDCE